MKTWQFVAIIVLGWVPAIVQTQLPKPVIEVRDIDARESIAITKQDVHALYVLYNNIHRIDREIVLYNEGVREIEVDLDNVQDDLFKLKRFLEETPAPPPEPMISEKSQGYTNNVD